MSDQSAASSGRLYALQTGDTLCSSWGWTEVVSGGRLLVPLATGTTLANCFYTLPHPHLFFSDTKNNFLLSLGAWQCPPPGSLPWWIYLKSPLQGRLHQWQALNSGLCTDRASTVINEIQPQPFVCLLFWNDTSLNCSDWPCACNLRS